MRRTQLQEQIDLYIHKSSIRAPDPGAVSKAIYREINELYPPRHSHRQFVTMLIGYVFNRSIELIACGQYPSAYVEIHALLEEIAIALLPRRLETKNEGVLATLIDRRTLSDVAPAYAALAIWSDLDVGVVRRLAGVRNGVSHRNFRLLAKHVNRNAPGHHLSSFNFTTEDAATTLRTAVTLVVKMVKIHKRRPKKRGESERGFR
jgi:hypothetical protein